MKYNLYKRNQSQEYNSMKYLYVFIKPEQNIKYFHHTRSFSCALAPKISSHQKVTPILTSIID